MVIYTDSWTTLGIIGFVLGVIIGIPLLCALFYAIVVYFAEK